MSEFCAYNGSWSCAFLSCVCSCAENKSLSMDVAFSLFQLWLFAYKCCRSDSKFNFSARKILMPAFSLWHSSIKMSATCLAQFFALESRPVIQSERCWTVLAGFEPKAGTLFVQPCKTTLRRWQEESGMKEGNGDTTMAAVIWGFGVARMRCWKCLTNAIKCEQVYVWHPCLVLGV